VSVAAAARENQLKSRGSLIYAIVNKGAFAAAAVIKFQKLCFISSFNYDFLLRRLVFYLV